MSDFLATHFDTAGRAGAQSRELDDPRSFASDEFPYDGHDNVETNKFAGSVPTPRRIGWEDEVDVVDDEALGIEEAIGTPINFAQSDGHKTSSIPGASTGWSSDPAKPWDEEEDLEGFMEWLVDETQDPEVVDLKTFFDLVGRDDDREVVDMLASSDVMNTDVWERLLKISR